MKIPGEVIEQREKKKYLRAESRFYKDEENPNPFMRKEIDDKLLINFLCEMLVKSNNMLQLLGSGKSEELRVLEMSLNKEGIMRKFLSLPNNQSKSIHAS